nr:hypothetical protein [Alteromonas genovensis]
MYREEQTLLLKQISNALSLDEFVGPLLKRLPKQYLAAHIRRTDMLEHWNKTFPGYKYPSIEDYSDMITRLVSDESFFVCCDDQSTVSTLYTKFGIRLVNYEGTFNEDAFRQTSMKHALIDLIILSQANQLIITPGSSFSDFASNVAEPTMHKPPMMKL